MLLNGFVQMSVLLKVGGQIGAAHGIPRVDLGCSLEVRVGFIGFVQQQEGTAKIVVRDEVFIRHGQRVRP